MNNLIEEIIDIYGQIGDFHITPFDGAISILDADAQAEKVVKDYTDTLLEEARAEIERLQAEAKAQYDRGYYDGCANPIVQHDALREALADLLHAVCGEKGFAEAVRRDSGRVYPWPALDLAEAKAIAALERSE